MNHLTIQSTAKVNLALDILGVQEKGPFKGYHKIQTIFHEITPQNTHGFLPDIISIKVFDAIGKSSRGKSSIHLPENFRSYDNTLFKAANLIIKNYCQNSPKKIEIKIEKNIPIASGLGGGSSNAAAVLKALNELLNLHLSVKELESLAAQIGMDVPFFIQGGVALGENFGELITHLPEVKGLAFTLFHGAKSSQTQNAIRKIESVSNSKKSKIQKLKKTHLAYSQIDLSKCGKQTDKTIALLHAIRTNDHSKIHENIHNDFETLLKTPLPQNYHLTGSGPTYFLVS
jgi:4-diphosphocytidyl-2-C-methyl-D-erythritol kinase